jgi:hypothetical protein
VSEACKEEDIMVKTVVNDKKGLVQSVGSGLTFENAVTHSGALTTSSDAGLGTASILVGEIPITSAYAQVDAAGSARAGIRFAGAGTAGQLLVVENSGGEKLTFDASDSLLTGFNGSGDVMVAGGLYLFCSNGTTWTFIGGGAATDTLGLQAS